MRIVAGEFKGRVIDAPKDRTTRPTTDRVRESMFSSIYSRMDMEGAVVLDAFGGSGALGLEALSRGADRVAFWEQDADSRAVLEGNIASLKLDRRRATCKSGDVLQAASRPLSFGQAFNLVLLDPPYALDPSEVAGFLQALFAHGDIEAGTVVVYEHSIDNKQPIEELFDGLPGFEISGQKKYGKVGVTYLEVKEHA